MSILRKLYNAIRLVILFLFLAIPFFAVIGALIALFGGIFDLEGVRAFGAELAGTAAMGFFLAILVGGRLIRLAGGGPGPVTAGKFAVRTPISSKDTAPDKRT